MDERLVTTRAASAHLGLRRNHRLGGKGFGGAMWVTDVDAEGTFIFSNYSLMYGEQAAVALAFDAFFTEVQFQVAAGRLPFYVGDHESIYRYWAAYGENVCEHCGYKFDPKQEGVCRAFHPRQP